MNVRRGARLHGIVQGVGLRPFIAREARRLELDGFVANTSDGVSVEVEGAATAVQRFASALQDRLPPGVHLTHLDWVELPPGGDAGFRIRDSSREPDGAPRVSVAPDATMCAACWAEVRDPAHRRHGHPFATCTECGPRFSMTRALPFDREGTSMAAFGMCSACRREYEDPADRRHHAQGIACPQCGPRPSLIDAEGAVLAGDGAWLTAATEVLRRGHILALMGVGGFQLLVDARDQDAVQRLRARKARPAKPLAIMVADLAAARRLAALCSASEQALTGAAGPIVLVPRRGDDLAEAVAPGRGRLGVLLPTTPLHGLLIEAFGGPLVATSGNRDGEPIARTVDEARDHLGAVADAFLVHDRQIERRCDDAVVHVVDGALRVLRLGRGFSPTRVALTAADMPDFSPVLALGGHLKVAPAVAYRGEVVVWPHVGDLQHPRARAAMVESLEDLQRLAAVTPEVLACDAHPDYATSQWAERSGRSVVPVWHHHAHAAAVMAEHAVDDALALTWDGTGLGPDGTAWGGEVLQVDRKGARRVGHLRPFAMPGGDAAARDGTRPLVGLLATAGLDLPADLDLEARPIPSQLTARLPQTTSIGRLFDAAAALVGLCTHSRYEGEAAARLEELVSDPLPPPYPVHVTDGVLDWGPMLRGMIDERHDATRVAGRLHASLVAFAVDAAVSQRASRVVLAGGCFANRTLVETISAELRTRDIRPLVPTRIPGSDGGLALGQAWVAVHRQSRRA